MSGWTQLWTRVGSAAGFARTLKLRTQSFVHRLYDRATVTRWLRTHRRQHYVRAMQCVRTALDSPRRRALMLSATGVYKTTGGDDTPPGEDKNDFVTDKEMQDLMQELRCTEQLSRATLYCRGCGKRLVIDTKRPGIDYCKCDNGKSFKTEEHDGWMPYVETQDAIIWRREQRPGSFAYKVYGRYAEVNAADFIRVQTDCAYRRTWDSAVAALSTVDRCHRGVVDQVIIHWEVMWPRLFANRDYVYVRRNKEYSTPKTRDCDRVDHVTRQVDEPATSAVESEPNGQTNRYEAPPRSKRKESERVTVIVSKSCKHPKVPETKNAIRVTEYWSNMVVRSLEGVDSAGMEFVLTYYDEPGAGGMPAGVAAWAAASAVPQYLARMRVAAVKYRAWLHTRPQQEEDFEGVKACDQKIRDGELREEDMESTKRGPIMEQGEWTTESGAATQPNTEPRLGPADASSTEAAQEKNDTKPTVETQANAEVKSATVEIMPTAEVKSPAVENKLTEEVKSPALESKLTEEVKSPALELTEEVKSPALENKLTEEVKSPALENKLTEEVKSPALKNKTSAEVKTGTEESQPNSVKKETKEHAPAKSASEEEREGERSEEESSGGWWRYLHPFYYFA